jgi:hypothetical protein
LGKNEGKRRKVAVHTAGVIVFSVKMMREKMKGGGTHCNIYRFLVLRGEEDVTHYWCGSMQYDEKKLI